MVSESATAAGAAGAKRAAEMRQLQPNDSFNAAQLATKRQVRSTCMHERSCWGACESVRLELAVSVHTAVIGKPLQPVETVQCVHYMAAGAGNCLSVSLV